MFETDTKNVKQETGLKENKHVSPSTAENVFSCSYCGKAFKLKQHYTRHQQVHTQREKRHICIVCSKAFTNKSYLNEHEKTHSAEKPYPCPKCDEWFGQPAHLKTHWDRVHNTLKHFKCQTCPKEFAMNYLLNKHKKMHDKPVKAKKIGKEFQCETCSKSYSKRYNLIKHNWEHKNALLFL